MNNLKNSRLRLIKKVDAILNYGKIYSSLLWNVIFVIILFFAICLILVAIFIGLNEIQSIDKESTSAVGSVIGGCSIGCFVLIVDLIMYAYVNYGRKKAKIFLGDAVLLDAETKSLGSKTEIRFPVIFASAYAIRVIFYFNERKIIKDSIYKEKLVYLPIFKDYINRKIKIAYSPKYDQVLILKDEIK